MLNPKRVERPSEHIPAHAHSPISTILASRHKVIIETQDSFRRHQWRKRPPQAAKESHSERAAGSYPHRRSGH